MINQISSSHAQLLQLDNNIRITSDTSFSAQEAFENTLEDVSLEEAKNIEQKRNEKVNFSNLGAPAGFFLDTSLLDEMESGGFSENNSKKPQNPYMFIS